MKRFDDTDKDPGAGAPAKPSRGDTVMDRQPPAGVPQRTLASPLGQPITEPEATVPVINAPPVPATTAPPSTPVMNAPRGTRISASPTPMMIPRTVTVPPHVPETATAAIPQTRDATVPPIPPTVDATANGPPLHAPYISAPPPAYVSAPPPAYISAPPPAYVSAPLMYGPNHPSVLSVRRPRTAWWVGPVIGGVVIVVIVVMLTAFSVAVGSSSPSIDREQAFIDSATPCPSPWTCTAQSKERYGIVPICTQPPTPSDRNYARGDIVIVRQTSSSVHSFARVRSVRGASITVEDTTGSTLVVTSPELIGRVCR